VTEAAKRRWLTPPQAAHLLAVKPEKIADHGDVRAERRSLAGRFDNPP
jgi:hypothetical protein